MHLLGSVRNVGIQEDQTKMGKYSYDSKKEYLKLLHWKRISIEARKYWSKYGQYNIFLC